MTITYDKEQPETSSEAIRRNAQAYPFAAAATLINGDPEDDKEDAPPEQPDDAWIPRRAGEVTARDIHELMGRYSSLLNSAGMFNLESSLWEETAAALSKLDRGLLAPGDVMLAVKDAIGKLGPRLDQESASSATGLLQTFKSPQLASLKKKKFPGSAGRPTFLKGSSTPEEWQKKKKALSRDAWRQASAIDTLLGTGPTVRDAPRRQNSHFEPVLAPVPESARRGKRKGGKFDPAAVAPQPFDRADAAFDANALATLEQQEWAIPSVVCELAIAFAWMQIGLGMLAQYPPGEPDFADGAPTQDSATDAEDIGRLLVVSGMHTFTQVLTRWSARLGALLFQAVKTACADIWNILWHDRLPDGHPISGDDRYPDQQGIRIRLLQPDADPEEFERQFTANFLMLWTHVSGEVRTVWDNYGSVSRRDRKLAAEGTGDSGRAENMQSTALTTLGAVDDSYGRQQNASAAGTDDVEAFLRKQKWAEKTENLAIEVEAFQEMVADQKQAARAAVSDDAAMRATQPSDDTSTVQFSVGYEVKDDGVVFEAAEAAFANTAHRNASVAVMHRKERIGPDQGLQSAIDGRPQAETSTVGAVASTEAQLLGQVNAVARPGQHLVFCQRAHNPLQVSPASKEQRTYVEASVQRWAKTTGKLRVIHVEFHDSSPNLARFQALQVNRNGTSTGAEWEIVVNEKHKQELLSIARPSMGEAGDAGDMSVYMDLSDDAQMLLQPGMRFFEQSDAVSAAVTDRNATGAGLAAATGVVPDLNSFFVQRTTSADAGIPESLFSKRPADSPDESARSKGSDKTKRPKSKELVPMVPFVVAGAAGVARVGEEAAEALFNPRAPAVRRGATGWIRRNPLRAVAGAVVATALTAGGVIGGGIAYLSGAKRNDPDDDTSASNATSSATNASTTPTSTSSMEEIPHDNDFDHNFMPADDPNSKKENPRKNPRIISIDDFERLYPENYDYDELNYINKYTSTDDFTRFFIDEIWESHFEFNFLKASDDGVGGIDFLEANIDLKFARSSVDDGGKTKALFYVDKKTDVIFTMIVPVSNTRIKKDIDRQINMLNADVSKVKKDVTFDQNSNGHDEFQYGSYILYPGQQATITSIDDNFQMRILVPASKDENDRRAIVNNSATRFYGKSLVFLDSHRSRYIFRDHQGREKLVLTGDHNMVRKLAESIRILVPRTMINEQHRFSDVHERNEKNRVYFSYSLANDRHVIYGLIESLRLYDNRILQAEPEIAPPVNPSIAPFAQEYYSNLLIEATGIGNKYARYWNKVASVEENENNLYFLASNIRLHLMRSMSQYENKLTEPATELLRLAFLKSVASSYSSGLQQLNLNAADAEKIKNNIARFPDITISNFKVLGKEFNDVIQFFDKKTKITVLYFIGASDPFFEFNGQDELNEWFRGIALNNYADDDIKGHIELSDRSERVSAISEIEHGFDYLLDHSDENTNFFGMKPVLIEGENYFLYFAQVARIRLLNDARFIQARSEYMLGGYYARTSEPTAMGVVNANMVKMVSEIYTKLGPPHVKNEHFLNTQGRELYWIMEVEKSGNMEYAYISQESVEKVLNEMDLEKQEPDIILVAGRANRMDLQKLLKEIATRIDNGNNCSGNKNCLDFEHYKNAVDIVHDALGHGVVPSFTERSMYIEQINRLKDIQTLTTGDNTEKDYRKINRSSWELAALAYRSKIESDYHFHEKDILEISTAAMAIDQLVVKLVDMDESENNNNERKRLLIAIANELGVYSEWRTFIDDDFPLVHHYIESEDADRTAAASLQAQVFQSLKVISSADIRYVRLAENYLRKFRPEMAESSSDFRWQLEIARLLGEMKTLPDKEEYGLINMVGIDRAATFLQRDKGMKWYSQPTMKEFLEKSLENTMEDLLDNVYERGQPYWTKQADGSELDPSGSVRRVPMDVTPGIVTDYSGYTLNLFLHNLDKALENPLGDLSVQIMRVHGEWTEDDMRIAKAVGAAVQKLLELTGYIPLVGQAAAVGLALRPIASSVTKFIKRRVDQGGSFGRQDVKDVGTVIWTYVGLKIPNDRMLPANIFGHIAVGEGIGMIPD